MHVKHTNEAHSCNNCYRGKAIIIKYSECVFLVVGVQHARCMPVRFYSTFSHYFLNGTVFEKKLLNVKCVFFNLFSLLLLSEKFLVPIRIEGMYIGLHVKCPLFFCYFNETRIFSTNFRKVLKYQFS
jgi:hypothetical protein